MQPIQDKDFDQLFKDAFDEAEVTPSKDLWGSIEKEIEPKKKRIIPIYWLSAAAVLIITTVGVLIYQQQSEDPKQFANNQKPKVEQPKVDELQTQDQGISTEMQSPIEKVGTSKATNDHSTNALAKVVRKENVVKPLEQQKIVTAPEAQKQETMIAQNQPVKQDELKQKIDEVILKPEIVTAKADPGSVIDEPANENDQSIRGIRNVGDVVNLIVNKVDKRKDKFIQFRTDDDDSSLSSINIGPFKIGKRNKR